MTPEAVLNLLRQQIGRESAIKAPEIVEILTNQRSTANQERQIRAICQQLCNAGWPICSSSYHGYWWAADSAEVQEACRSLHGRAVASLTRISRLKKLAIPLLNGQLLFPVDWAQPTIPDVGLVTHQAIASRIVEIPDTLDQLIARYLESRSLDQNQLYALALAQFLAEAQVPGAKEIYRQLAEA